MKNYLKISISILAIFAILPVMAIGADFSRVDDDDDAPVRRHVKNAPSYVKDSPIHLTEKMHEEFLENDNYALADGLLNATWGLLKANLPESEYREALASQREWVKVGRNVAVVKLMKEMPLVDAYAKVIQERADFLASLISGNPRDGKYDNKYGSFTVYSADGMMSVEGNSTSGNGMHVCDFSGEGAYVVDGWSALTTGPDTPDFYLLFTRKGASIYYSGSELSQGCATGAGFSGNYRYIKK